MYKNICVCDSCGKELKYNSEHYHIDFASSRFCDAAGDMDYNTIRIDLCEQCCHKAVNALNIIALKYEVNSN